MPRLYIFDTMCHIFRAYYAFPSTLTNSEGLATNAMYGLLSIFHSIWRSRNIQYCVAVFESRTPNFRVTEIDPNYKANRPPTPCELKNQIPLIIEMLGLLGIETISVDGYEADDTVGTLAKRCSQNGTPATIISNDKDLAQILANDGYLELLKISSKPGRGAPKHIEQTITKETVLENYGVTAEQIPSWLALQGDSADNIKGLPGIGNKRAISLLKNADVPSLLKNPQLAGKYADLITENRQQLERDLKLATIHQDVPLPFEGLPMEERFKLKPIAPEAREFMVKMGMRSFVKSLDETMYADTLVSDLWQ